MSLLLDDELQALNLRLLSFNSLRQYISIVLNGQSIINQV